MFNINFLKLLIILILSTKCECNKTIEITNASISNHTADFILTKLLELKETQSKENAENAAKLAQLTTNVELIVDRLKSLNELITNQAKSILQEIKEMEPNEKLKDLLREDRDYLLTAINENGDHLKESDDAREPETSENPKENTKCETDHSKSSQKQVMENINKISEEISRLYNQSQACQSETSRISDIYMYLSSYQGCDEAMLRSRYSGVHSLVVKNSHLPSFKAYCLKDKRHVYAPAWTIIQRRQSNSSHFINFKRNWDEYKTGFGDPRYDHWLGLDKIFALVNSRRHELWVYIENKGGERLSSYHDDFSIGDESQEFAILSLGKNTGSADMRNCVNVTFNTYDKGDSSFSKSNGGTGFWGPCKLNYNSQRIDSKGKPYVDIVLFNRDIVYMHFAIRPIRPRK